MMLCLEYLKRVLTSDDASCLYFCYNLNFESKITRRSEIFLTDYCDEKYIF